MAGLPEVVLILVQMAVVMAATAGLFAWDERRMTAEQRARAWPPATRLVVIGSPLWFPLWIVGVPLHFVLTRRSFRGVVEAVLATAGVFGLLLLAAYAVSFAFGDALQIE